ncbi:DUF58 domain-containing protein [bacterium]|nr:DUF58 domain-containing protein [bacterium]
MENDKPANHTLFDSKFLGQLERLAILSRQSLAGQMQGERRSPKKGQSVEFSDFRPYTLGDDFRRIDWNAFARLEKFFIKLFVEEEDITIHLLIDSSTSMDWGTPNKHNYAIKTAAALGYIALVGLDRLTVTSVCTTENSSGFLPTRGKRQAHTLFTYLENLNPVGSQTLVKSISNFRSTNPQAGPAILISDLYDPDWKQALSLLAAGKYEITLLHLLAPDELSPDLSGDLKLLDSETNTEVEITADYDLLQRYKENLANWQTEIDQFCTKRGIHYIPLDTSISLQELLFNLLRRQTVLK